MLLTSAARATSPVPQGLSPQPDRVIHLWVDPVNGNDLLAYSWNPVGSTPICPGANWVPFSPLTVQDSYQNSAPLLHAPWPFKTMRWALLWLNNNAPLPWFAGGYYQRYAIIHLLPGVYARYTTAHPDNGVAGNGEPSFPINLPSGVSIRGTSALNTIIDLYDPVLQKGVGPAFEFGGPTFPTADGVATFIDRVTIYGADTPPDNDGSRLTGAAIAIGPNVSSRPTITNCILVRNHIGILIAASKETNPQVVHDGTTIINNTITWNGVGIWNGQLNKNLSKPTSAVGLSKLLVVNNILDATPGLATAPPPCAPPSWRVSQIPARPWSACEGLCGEDTNVITGALGVDHNAYENSKVNALGTVAGLPPVTRRPGTIAPFQSVAAREISAITNVLAPTTPRGVLYVRDLLCVGPFAPSSPSGVWDASPMDFRLSPAILTGTGATPQLVNPLVDSGWAGTFTGGPQNLQMLNGLALSQEPGFLSLPGAGNSQNTWAFSCWGEDCEGFGNRRVEDHVALPNSGFGRYVDIGADEMGDMIVAGYASGTTAFLSLSLPNTSRTLDNKYVWFLGLPNSLGYTPLQVGGNGRPVHRLVDHLANPPTAYQLQTKSLTWFGPTRYQASPYYVPGTADITPHLIPDLHPWWNVLPGNAFSPTNAIWPYCLPGFYNPRLYQNPTSDTINPPGAHYGNSQNFEWLDLNNPYAVPNVSSFTFIPRGPSAPLVHWQYDSWCRAENPPQVGNVDVMPSTVVGGTAMSVRFSLERPLATWGVLGGALNQKNLQSFDVIVQ